MSKLTPTQMIEISAINVATHPDRFRPGDTSIDELAASIHEHGLLQAVVAVPATQPGYYDLIAGQRRLLAHIALGRTAIEAKILDRVPAAIHELRLTENLQREDLSPIETAVAIKRWRDQQNITQEHAAELLGRGLSWIKKTESLLSLQDDLMDAVHAGSISPSVATTLKAVEDDATRSYYLDSALQYGATQDVATTWVQNYTKDRTPPDPDHVLQVTQNSASSHLSHQLPCHACQKTFDISTLRTAFLCSDDYNALAGATRNVPS
jgi:ParB family chromosome partitioning protein